MNFTHHTIAKPAVNSKNVITCISCNPKTLRQRLVTPRPYFLCFMYIYIWKNILLFIQNKRSRKILTEWRIQMKMKMKSRGSSFFMFFFVAFSSIQVCLADCDNLQDTCPAAPPGKQTTTVINGLPCKNPANITAEDFKTTELSKAGSRDSNFGASMKIVTAFEFPGLNTLGLSIGRTDIEEDGAVDFHNHPRATEMVFVTKGVLVAGFLDTQNKLFQVSLKEGDVCVFPRGLFHFYLNGGSEVATVFSVFNSQNPGLGSLTATPSGTSTLESVEKVKRWLNSLSDSQVHDVTDFTSPGLESIYS